MTLAESGGSAVFTVSLSQQSSTTVTVAYATANDTARAGSDYTARSGTLAFQPGERRKTITIPVLDDSDDEANETFTVRLSSPHNATLSYSQGTATITDDAAANPPPPPPPPELTIHDATVPEDAGSARFTVSLSRQSTALVTVDFATSDVTARAGSDYAASGGTLTFQPGETGKTLAVPVLDDSEDEADETFTVGLSNPRNATWRTPTGPPPSRTSGTPGSVSPSAPRHTP